MNKFFKSSYMAIILILVYIPIFILIVFSFNSTSSLYSMQGISGKWYVSLFQNKPFLLSITLSLIIGIFVTFTSVLIGIMAAIGLSKVRKVTQKVTLGITNIPLINADVVTAVSLMLLFLSISISFGPFTLILAHISFDIPYVIVIILPRLKKIDPRLIEASTDLGATPTYTLFRVIIPILKPAIITASVIAFTMSFDDFIISYFSGGGAENVGTYIYSLKIIQPYVNAFGAITISLVAFFFLFLNITRLYIKSNTKKMNEIIKDVYKDVWILDLEARLTDLYLEYNYFLRTGEKIDKKMLSKIKKYEMQIFKEKQYILKIKNKMEKEKIKNDKKYLKELASKNKFYFLFKRIWKQVIFISFILGSFLILVSAYVINSQYDLSIAIWGEYLPQATIDAFQNKYDLKLKVSIYDSNEALYNKLQTYNKYDIMVPSAYMAVKLAKYNYLQKIDYSKIATTSTNGFSSADDFWKNQVDPVLNASLTKSKPINSKIDVRDYQIPYYWGDIRVTINPTQSNLQFLIHENPNLKNFINETNWTIKDLSGLSEAFSWNDFINAAKSNKRMVISDDPKNMFLAESENILNKVEPQTNSNVDKVANATKNWAKNPNVMFQGDEITNSFDNKQFDFGLSYNGDVLSSMINNNNHSYAVIYPHLGDQGADIWEDGLVINRKTPHLSNVYKFLNYVIQNQWDLDDSNDIGYTSPFLEDEKKIITKPRYQGYEYIYIPLFFERDDNLELKNELHPGDGTYWNNESDKHLVDKYSEIIASKTG